MENCSPLDDIRIASPCHASWEAMRGDDRVRYCAACRLRVYNVEGLTRYELKRLLAQNEQRLCLRLVRRSDGTLLTRDCPVGLRALRRRLARLVAGMVALLAALLVGTFFPRFGSSGRKGDSPYGPLERLAEWMRSPQPPAPVLVTAMVPDPEAPDPFAEPAPPIPISSPPAVQAIATVATSPTR